MVVWATSSPGDRPLFGGTPVRSYKETVLDDVRDRGKGLDPDSSEHVPREMFVASVFVRHELFLPPLHVDRAFARRVDRDGTRYREIHVPMVGEPVNLHLAPPETVDGIPLGERPAFEIVKGDVCVFVELDGSDASLVEDVTALLLDRIAADEARVRKELDHLRGMAIETVRDVYESQTRAPVV
ncbi:MAG: hypothetical protein ABEJ44_02940 [Halanaeroarchaeum sp.]